MPRRRAIRGRRRSSQASWRELRAEFGARWVAHTRSGRPASSAATMPGFDVGQALEEGAPRRARQRWPCAALRNGCTAPRRRARRRGRGGSGTSSWAGAGPSRTGRGAAWRGRFRIPTGGVRAKRRRRPSRGAEPARNAGSPGSRPPKAIDRRRGRGLAGVRRLPAARGRRGRVRTVPSLPLRGRLRRTAPPRGRPRRECRAER